MANLTPRLSLTQQIGADSPTVMRTGNAQNTTILDAAALFDQGTLVLRPAAGTVPYGTFYRSTDTGDLSYSTGSAWVSVALVGTGSSAVLYLTGTLPSRPATPSAGTAYWATDVKQWSLYTGTAWVPVGFTGFTALSNATSVIGQAVIAAPGVTVTLPPPALGAQVSITTGDTVSGTSPVTVLYGAGGGMIYGVGLLSTGVSSFLIGSPVASVTLTSTDGSAWVITSGQQDTGWLAISKPASWTDIGGYYTLAGRLQGDTVILRGEALNGTGGSATFSTSIPSALRPASNVNIGTTTGLNILSVGGAGSLFATNATGNGSGISLSSLYQIV